MTALITMSIVVLMMIGTIVTILVTEKKLGQKIEKEIKIIREKRKLKEEE